MFQNSLVLPNSTNSTTATTTTAIIIIIRRRRRTTTTTTTILIVTSFEQPIKVPGRLNSHQTFIAMTLH